GAAPAASPARRSRRRSRPGRSSWCAATSIPTGPATRRSPSARCDSADGLRGVARAVTVAGGVAVEAQRRGVHAVALAGGTGTVGEDVAEVGAAGGAQRLGADHAVAGVGAGRHRVVADRLPEARPAGARLVLGGRGEQGAVADDAAVEPVVLAVPVDAGERRLGAAALGDLVLLGGEALAQLVVGGDAGLVGHGVVGLPSSVALPPTSAARPTFPTRPQDPCSNSRSKLQWWHSRGFSVTPPP